MSVLIGTRHVRTLHGVLNEVGSLLHELLLVHIIRHVEDYLALVVYL